MTEPREKLGRPPVDSLSDVAWARVERNVLTRMESTVTAAAGMREIRPQPAFALAFFSMNGPSATPATQGSDEPSRIVAGDAPSSVTFGELHLTLDAKSALVMDQSATKPTAVLEHGAVQFAIPARADRQFTVLAGDMLVRTKSAEFRVSRDGELANVSVTSGTVRVTFRGHDVTVAAKQSWTTP
jgi:ferric-dicitrate binding protein FerR (iron transport regulator)